MSAEAHKLAYKHKGQKLYIPMGGEIDSLNASMAGLCIMFEILKQNMDKTSKVVSGVDVQVDKIRAEKQQQ